MKNNLGLLLLLALIAVAPNVSRAQSWNREDLQTPKDIPADLLQETQELKISDEGTVQKKNPAPHLFVGVSAGLINLGNFSVQGASEITNYDMDHYVPNIGITVENYPTKWEGRWGWAVSGSYAYAEFDSGNPIAMHIIPVSLAAAYRYKVQDRQLLIPYGQLGPAAWVYFQRGLDQDNTSGVSFSAIATAGLSLNLNELGLFDGRNGMEINVQYSRSFLGISSTSFIGDSISAGATMVF